MTKAAERLKQDQECIISSMLVVNLAVLDTAKKEPVNNDVTGFYRSLASVFKRRNEIIFFGGIDA